MSYSTIPIQPQMVFDKNSYAELESQLDELDAQFKIREIEVTFNTQA